MYSVGKTWTLLGGTLKEKTSLVAAIGGLEGLGQLEKDCSDLLARWGIEQPSICFVLREVLINAYEANVGAGQADAFLEITLLLGRDNKIAAHIPDYGAGLPPDWKKTCAAADMNNLLWEERGRGLLFMREFCEDMDSGRDEQGRHSMILKVGTTG